MVIAPLRLFPYHSHAPQLLRGILETTALQKRVLDKRDRPHLSQAELLLGSSTVGGFLLVHTDCVGWRRLALASFEVRRCVITHLQLTA